MTAWTCFNIIFIGFISYQRLFLHASRLSESDENVDEVNSSGDDGETSLETLPDHQVAQKLLLMNLDTFSNNQHEPGFDFTEAEMKKLKLWPNGVIPYYIDKISFQDNLLRKRIRTFLENVVSLANIYFLELSTPPRDEKTRWVLFLNRRSLLGCADHAVSNFTNDGVQHVVLGYDCMVNGGELAAAVLAIAGVPAQHNAPNRDKYIKIIKQNIQADKLYLFKKVKDTQWLFHDLYYDARSAGHYHLHRYSINGSATIVPKSNIDPWIGEGDTLSRGDIQKLQMLYNYIGLNRKDKARQCNSLFTLRSAREVDQNKVVIKPRRKPNQYLGLPAKDKNKKLYKKITTTIVNVDISNEENNAKDSANSVQNMNDSSNSHQSIEDIKDLTEQDGINKNITIYGSKTEVNESEVSDRKGLGSVFLPFG